MDNAAAYRDARVLMNQHGLGGWIIEWDRAKRRKGQTDYVKRTISLSYEYVRLNPESVVRNTILHEIAHALVGSGNGHNEVWRQKFISIGGNGQRCTTAPVQVEGKIVGTCPDGHLWFKHRWTKKLRTVQYYCSKHGNGFQRYPIQWRENRGLTGRA